MPKAGKSTVKQRKISERSLKNLKPFVKGDPRINRLGRPKNIDQIRALIQDIAGEVVEPNKEWSRIEVLLRAMFISKNSQDRRSLMEYGWGIVPRSVNLSINWQQEVADAVRAGVLSLEEVRRDLGDELYAEFFKSPVAVGLEAGAAEVDSAAKSDGAD
jgi:hypothetical protein